MYYKIVFVLQLILVPGSLLALDYTASTAFGLGLALTKEPVDTLHGAQASQGYVRFSTLKQNHSGPFFAFDISWLSISATPTPYFGTKQMGSGMGIVWGVSRPKHELWSRFGRGEGRAPEEGRQNHFLYYHSDIGISYKFYQTRFAVIAAQYIHSFYWGNAKWQEVFPSRLLVIPQIAASVSLYSL